MLWTIMPEDIIMADSDKIKTAQEYSYRNRRILGYPAADGKVCIIQILSTNPRDFLDPRFQPGSLVDCKKL